VSIHKWINVEDGTDEQCLTCGVVQPAMFGDNQRTCLPTNCPDDEVFRAHHYALDRPWTGHYVTSPGEAGADLLHEQPVLTVFGGWTIRCVFCGMPITETTVPSSVVWNCAYVSPEGAL
jgi:hypothetical protein